MSAPSRLKVFVCPHCEEQQETQEWQRSWRHVGELAPEHWHREIGWVQAEEVEVIPVSEPNVLSVKEAELLKLLTTPYAQLVGGETGERADLEMRLEDWASKEEQ